MNPAKLDRRLFLGVVMSVGVAGTACAQTPRPRSLAVFKTPTCACCDAWMTHMRAAGFSTAVTILPDLQSVRRRHGLPDGLAACHTAVIDGYVVEGHVPAADVVRMLAERPDAVGLAVPAMPLGSPGMETPQGHKDPYDTLLVLRTGATRVFARHNQPT